ncbi:flavin reductase family protein [Nocardioides sp. R-C-SC26]|uniref:flavin reductase family protein n=1 Tax=Nocardioides sp. R-C-SC26 TaxID=2870414 RepID=UPI001E2E29C4|nr:flavin reductase family protein [Nocardioides sp. R-C-SC26]
MTEPLFDTAQFRAVCSQFPTGVTAVTAIDADGECAALTVNSFTSVSLEPAQVLFCIGTSASSYPLISRATRVAVHVLRQDQEEIARRFATSGVTAAEKLAGVSWSAGPGGVPVLPDTSATLLGTVGDRIHSGDHVIVLLDVDHVDLKPSPLSALAFYQGRFAAPVGPVAPTA